MRLWALDASAPDGQTLRGLEPREGQEQPDLVLLFGGAAVAAAEEASAERQRRDEGFLESAARYLLSGNGEPAPERASMASWLSRTRVVSREPAARFHPLPVSDRDIEMVDTLLLMAVPRSDELDEEALINASVWIAGGQTAPRLEDRETRALLSPGDFLQTGARLELELVRGQLKARVMTADGREEARLEMKIAARNRMSVK